MKKNKGITLIALVVTIVILIILASVTLNMVLSNNGLLDKTKKATTDYVASSESEALSMYIVSSQLENADIILGESLYDKSLYNGDTWNMVFTNDGKTYGTGWNYIEKGAIIEGYGDIKNSWLVNTTTKEIIKLEEGKYDKLNYKDSVAITDNLALNIDASNLEDGKWENIEQYGEVKYDQENSGILFDGDDYLKLTKPVNFEDGFTFELFIKLNSYGENTYNDSIRSRIFL